MKNVYDKTIGSKISQTFTDNDPKLVERVGKYWTFHGDALGETIYFYIDKILNGLWGYIEYDCLMIVKEYKDPDENYGAVYVGSGSMKQHYLGFFNNQEITKEEFFERYDNVIQKIKKKQIENT